MKRYWAVILTAATLASCRSNQPAANPFMRTTVPPPSTTGVMVTPGQPYAQGISPPLVTQPAPVITTPAPVTTQPVPVVPGPPPAAPMAAPPSVMPQGDQFRYPGGSYIFHQSSNDPPPAVPDVGEVRLASATEPISNKEEPVSQPPKDDAVAQATYVEPARVYVSGPMSQAPIIENPYVTAKNPPPAATVAAQPQVLDAQPAAKPLASAPSTASPSRAPAKSQPAQALAGSMPAAKPVAPTKISLGASRDEPPEKSGFTPVATNSGGGNTLRIVGESSPPASSPLVASKPATQVAISTPTPPPAASGSVMRITAGNNTPAIRSTVETSSSSSNLAIKTNPSGANTARIVSRPDGGEANVIQTSFQPAGSSSTISISPSSK
jgi:hypothetical protein